MTDQPTYTFSYYTKERVPVLEGKKWWQFWVTQKIGWKEQWVRKSYSGLTEQEAKLLMSYPPHHAVLELVRRLIGDSQNWMLERTDTPTVYYQPEICRWR